MKSPRVDEGMNPKLYVSSVNDGRQKASSMYQKWPVNAPKDIQPNTNLLTPNYYNRPNSSHRQDNLLRVTISTVDNNDNLYLNNGQSIIDSLGRNRNGASSTLSKSAAKYEAAATDRGVYNQNTLAQKWNYQKAENYKNNNEKIIAPSETTQNYANLMQKLSKKEQIIKQLQKLSETKVSDNIRKHHDQEKYKYQEPSPIRTNNYKYPKNTTALSGGGRKNTLELPSSTNLDVTRSYDYSKLNQDMAGPTISDWKDIRTVQRKRSDTSSTIISRNPEEMLGKDLFKLPTNNYLYNQYKKEQKIESIYDAKQKKKYQISKSFSNLQTLDNKNEFFSTTPNVNQLKAVSPENYLYQTYSPMIGRKRKESGEEKNLKFYKDSRQLPETKCSQSPKKLSINDFDIKHSLGQGKFGIVYQVFHKQTNSLFALKKISKKVIKSHLMVDQLLQEIKIQFFCNHQNILKIYGFFDDAEHIYLILEYMQDGTLFAHLKRQKTIAEQQAAVKVKQIALGINYLQQNGIAHRDIKPQNIVMSYGVGKLCDFGWAAICTDRRKTYCGTFDYVAPQILQGNQYDETVDLWCLGVLAYELLVGKAPFYHISRKQTMKKIMNVEKLQFPPNISQKAISFIEGLIKKNPQERMCGQDLLKHPFLATIESETLK